MRMRTRAIVAGGLVALVVFLVEARVAQACSCLPPDLKRSYDDSTDVLRGWMLSRVEHGDHVIYRVRVIAVFKGCHQPGEIVKIVTHESTATCGIPDLRPGVDSLFTATADERGSLRIFLCGYNVPFSSLTAPQRRFLKQPPPHACPERPCASSGECGEGDSCTTEDGVCNRPPGCAPGEICPAVCYGTCKPQPLPGLCRTDADCRTFSDYCTGCDCSALSICEPDPMCEGPGVQCFRDPCDNQEAFCSQGRCDLRPRSVLCPDGACGPQLGVPTSLCPDGTSGAGPTDRCLRQPGGSCAWEIQSCPDPGSCRGDRP